MQQTGIYCIVANNMVFGPFASRMMAVEYAMRYWSAVLSCDAEHVLTDYVDRGMAIVMEIRKPLE